MLRITMAFVALLCLLWCDAASAAQLQKIGDFQEPIYVTSDPGNPNRLFVVERQGRIDLVEGGAVTTLADLSSLVNTEVEDGLLSIALAPDFDASGRFYLDYTGKVEPGEIHVAEMRVSGGVAPLSSLEDVLTIEHPVNRNHNGGQLQFGPEGDLYVSTGDGGGNDDVHRNAQTTTSLLGKILRLEPAPGSVPPYRSPVDNPFVGVLGAREEIWSLGLRNPFRFSFDRSTGALLIGDVGEGAREEVDYALAPQAGRGANYGWNCREGLSAGPGGDLSPAECATTPFTEPVFDYPHSDPGGGRAFGCAITGGYLSRDPGVPELLGRYVYGDFCEGRIRSLDLDAPFASDRSEGLEVPELDSFGEDSAGRLYAVSKAGPVYRIVSGSPSATQLKAFLGLRASARRVKRGGRATLTAFVSPCLKSKATSVGVILFRGHRKLGRRHLSRVCTVVFRPRIRHRWRFHVELAENQAYLPARSRGVTIKLKLRAARGHR